MSLFDFARPHRRPLQSGMQHVLDELDRLDPKPVETLGAAEARQQPTPSDAAKALMVRRRLDPLDDLGVPTQDVSIPTRRGHVQARLYGRIEKGQQNPIILFWHGGGFVLADLDDYDATPRELARATDCLFLACHYRQGPEHRFPAAHEDAWDTYCWVLENAAQWGGDPRRLAVMGESAGGNLAINVAINARDAGVLTPLSQILVYPLVGTDMGTASYREHAHASPLNRAMVQWMLGHYLASPADMADPRMNVVNAELWGLPPTLIIAAEIDPLLSEGLRLAERLVAADVHTIHKCYPGVTHDFFGMAAVVKEAALAQAAVVTELRRRLALGIRGRIAHALG